MFYVKIHVLDSSVDGYMELYRGTLQRLTDLDGNTIDATSYTVTNDNPPQPSWALPDPPEPPPPPPPVPEAVSKSQLITQLIRSGVISEAAGIQAATIGSLPTALEAMISVLPSDQQLEAKIAWATVSEIRRDSTIINMIIDAEQLTGDDVDDIFRAAGQIVF